MLSCCDRWSQGEVPTVYTPPDVKGGMLRLREYPAFDRALNMTIPGSDWIGRHFESLHEERHLLESSS